MIWVCVLGCVFQGNGSDYSQHSQADEKCYLSLSPRQQKVSITKSKYQHW